MNSRTDAFGQKYHLEPIAIDQQIAKKYKANSKDISDISKKLSPTIMKKYRQNVTELFDLIRTKANELKDEAEKEREKDASKG